jgi:serine/threonine protein kinase
MVLNDHERHSPDMTMIGSVVANNFLLQAIVGTGAMGTIYRAEQKSLGKTVVIKLIHKDMLTESTLALRFHREARAASRLNHPNCIQIIDFGEMDDGRLYIAMEHVSGQDLGRVLFEEFPLRPERIIHIMRQVCLALDEAHANGVLHRDLKPENIMVGDRRNMKDFVKVLDFGIAKLMDSRPENPIQTLSGTVCGTPEYMSPEQARGDDIDGRSDLYSVGVILYQLLTNRLPFTGDNPLEIMTQHLTAIPVNPHQLVADAHPPLCALALQLLSKEREHRPPNALEIAQELELVGRDIVALEHGGARAESQTSELMSGDGAGSISPRATRFELRASPVGATRPGGERKSPAPSGAQEILTQDLRAAASEDQRRTPTRTGTPRGDQNLWASRVRLWILIALVAAAVVLVASIIIRANQTTEPVEEVLEQSLLYQLDPQELSPDEDLVTVG